MNSFTNGRPNSTEILFTTNSVENMIFHDFCGKMNSTEFMESKSPVEFGLPLVDEFTLVENLYPNFWCMIVCKGKVGKNISK